MTTDNNTFFFGRLPFFPQFFTKIQDLLSSRYHSEDFKQTRRQLVLERLRLLCLLFAITVPVSSVFDLLSLGEETALKLLPLRLILSLSLALLFYASHLRAANKYSNLLLCSAFLLPCLFFLSVEIVFQQLQTPMSNALAITPFLIITMLGLFPLTLKFGVTLFATIALINFGFNIFQLNLSVSYGAQHLWQLCLFGGVAIWLQLGQLSMLMKLYRESTIDPLTGLINRRVLMRQLTFACDQNKLDQSNYCLLMLDLDRFKRINDNHGHQTGDKVLVALADVLNKEAGNQHIAARFGGEEFVLLMLNTNIEQAITKATNIASTIREHTILSTEHNKVSVTTSIGICEYQSSYSPNDIIKRADELLYLAKQSGRDCIKY